LPYLNYYMPIRSELILFLESPWKIVKIYVYGSSLPNYLWLVPVILILLCGVQHKRITNMRSNIYVR